KGSAASLDARLADWLEKLVEAKAPATDEGWSGLRWSRSRGRYGELWATASMNASAATNAIMAANDPRASELGSIRQQRYVSVLEAASGGIKPGTQLFLWIRDGARWAYVGEYDGVRPMAFSAPRGLDCRLVGIGPDGSLGVAPVDDSA